MRNKLKVGIIGLGKQSIEDHIPAVLNSLSASLVAICDIKNNLVEQHSKFFNVVGYTSDKEMFEKEKLDFVIVAVPHNSYRKIVELAINKNVHIIKEKPFALNIEEGKFFASLSKEHNIHILTTVQRRFNPIFSTFFQLVDKIGELSFFEGRYTIFTDHPESGWRGHRELAGGGCIIDMGYHLIDLIVWYFGLPDKVFAEFSATAKEDVEYDAEDTASLIIKYEREKKLWGNLFISRVISPKQEFLRVVGSMGVIEVHRGFISRFSSDGKLLEKLSRENSWPSAFTDQIDYFSHIIKGERKSLVEPEYHLQHMAIIEAAYESSKSGNYIDPHKYI